MSSTQITAEQLKISLQGFNGTQTYHSHWLPRFYYTDGIKFLADKAQAYWLIDAIASHQTNPNLLSNPALREIQFWKLEVNSDKPVLEGTEGSARLICVEDDGMPPTITQTIPCTDFPLDKITLYLQKGNGYWVLMVPSEY